MVSNQDEMLTAPGQCGDDMGLQNLTDIKNKI